MINVKADEIHRLLFTSFTQNPTISLPSVNILYLSILSIFFQLAAQASCWSALALQARDRLFHRKYLIQNERCGEGDEERREDSRCNLSNPTLSLHSFILTVRRSPLWYKCLLAPAFHCCKNEKQLSPKTTEHSLAKITPAFWTISLPSRLKLDYFPPNSSGTPVSIVFFKTRHERAQSTVVERQAIHFTAISAYQQLTLYTLKSVFIFSILFSVHLLRC